MSSTPDDALTIFGGTGFVGGRFVELAARPCVVVPRAERTPPTAEVLYFISTTDNYHVFDDLHVDIDTNLGVLVDVLAKLTPGRSVFNFVSSWFVYGEGPLPATEDTPCHPKGFYSITKRAAEQLLISYCQTFGIHWRILRLSNVYGPGDRSVSARRNAMQYLVNRMRNGEEVGLYHDGEFTRDYLHVDDAARALELCVTRGPLDSIINVGSGVATRFRDVIELAHGLLGSTSVIKPMEPPAFHKVVQVKDFHMDNRRLQALGFTPRISLKEGIATLCR